METPVSEVKPARPKVFSKTKPIEAEAPKAPLPNEEPKKEAPVLKNKAPTKLKVLKNFNAEYAMHGRPGVSVTLRFKADQEISDPHIIKHLLQNIEAPVILIE